MIVPPAYLQVRLANGPQDRCAAERLRYQVFVSELGGDGSLVDHKSGLERDRFDAFVDHLILVDIRRDPKEMNHVVGVYRLLNQAGASQAGQFYSETEYDLSVLRQSNRPLLELGRSCIHPDYRGGMALFILWNGLAKYIAENRIEILFGVASFHGIDPKIYRPHFAYLYQKHLTPENLYVKVRSDNPLKMNTNTPVKFDILAVMRTMPSLVKAYIRAGGYVGDGAFIDQQFNTTDICLVMDTKRLSARHSALYSIETTEP
ncbi:MAG: GNAT family N-acyltransferase [Paracoccaceae bacterium]